MKVTIPRCTVPIGAERDTHELNGEGSWDVVATLCQRLPVERRRIVSGTLAADGAVEKPRLVTSFGFATPPDRVPTQPDVGVLLKDPDLTGRRLDRRR
jgi:hypothetical protein